MRLEKLKNNTAFAPLEARKVEAIAGEAYKKEAVVKGTHHKKHHHAAGHNKASKKLGDASKFFTAAPRPRGDDYGGRGRGGGGRGRGGRGYSRGFDRGGRQARAPRSSQQINIKNDAEFPSL